MLAGTQSSRPVLPRGLRTCHQWLGLLDRHRLRGPAIPHKQRAPPARRGTAGWPRCHRRRPSVHRPAPSGWGGATASTRPGLLGGWAGRTGQEKDGETSEQRSVTHRLGAEELEAAQVSRGRGIVHGRAAVCRCGACGCALRLAADPAEALQLPVVGGVVARGGPVVVPARRTTPRAGSGVGGDGADRRWGGVGVKKPGANTRPRVAEAELQETRADGSRGMPVEANGGRWAHSPDGERRDLGTNKECA